MTENDIEFRQPIRVVVFSSGPRLTQDVRQFLYRLEAHPEIELLGVIIQSESQTFRAVLSDLRRRRGVLVIPLLLAWLLGGIWRFVANPRAEMELGRKLELVSDRMHFVADIHSQKVLDRVRSLAPDLGLIYGSPILKPMLFEIPVLGTLGIHHGKVPEYRGNKTTFWAMYNGEETAGVTIQKVNAGLDTGAIVMAGEVTIGRRSQRAVWHELAALGLNLYVQAILAVKNGTANYRPQTGPKGKLYRNPKLRDLLTFWWRQTGRRFGRI